MGTLGVTALSMPCSNRCCPASRNGIKKAAMAYLQLCVLVARAGGWKPGFPWASTVFATALCDLGQVALPLGFST